MTAPALNVVSVTTSRISAIAGKDTCDVVFQTDQDLFEWEVRAGGGGVRQGLLVGFSPILAWQQVDDLVLAWNLIEFLGLTFEDLDALKKWDDVDSMSWDNADTLNLDELAGIQVLAVAANGNFRVDNEELTAGDQTYRINIYGKNAAGEWTAFG